VYLLDTHVILWWLTEPEKIALKARNIIANASNVIFLSSVSFLEMSIKRSLGRLDLPDNILKILSAEGFKIQPLLPEECLSMMSLPMIHQDPFDRMLIAQAKYNELTLITRDKKILNYPIVSIKA
jgi:PIN domain nuclease of toxin-antitoxin system